VPSVNAFINVNSVDGNVYFYKLSAAGSSVETALPTISGNSLRILAYPNPFKPVTSFGFNLDGPAAASLRIFDMNGALLTELLNGGCSAGYHSIRWNAESLPAGSMVAELKAGNMKSVTKLLLLK
jgi:hypothetical protein